MRRILITLAAVLALSGAMATEGWNGRDWVYTPGSHRVVAPSTAVSATGAVDSSFWSSAWNVLRTVFVPGMFMILK